jgi:hypothetical protein
LIALIDIGLNRVSYAYIPISLLQKAIDNAVKRDYLGKINPLQVEYKRFAGSNADLLIKNGVDSLTFLLALNLTPSLVEYIDNPALFALLALASLKGKSLDCSKKRHVLLGELFGIDMTKSDVKLLQRFDMKGLSSVHFYEGIERFFKNDHLNPLLRKLNL